VGGQARRARNKKLAVLIALTKCLLLKLWSILLSSETIKPLNVNNSMCLTHIHSKNILVAVIYHITYSG
jgi:hypothetical protein